MDTLRRYVELKEIIRAAQAEQKELQQRIVEEYGFKVGDVVTDGETIAEVNKSGMQGLCYRNWPILWAHASPLKADGKPDKRKNKQILIAYKRYDNWSKADCPRDLFNWNAAKVV